VPARSASDASSGSGPRRPADDVALDKSRRPAWELSPNCTMAATGTAPAAACSIIGRGELVATVPTAAVTSVLRWLFSPPPPRPRSCRAPTSMQRASSKTASMDSSEASVSSAATAAAARAAASASLLALVDDAGT